MADQPIRKTSDRKYEWMSRPRSRVNQIFPFLQTVNFVCSPLDTLLAKKQIFHITIQDFGS